MVGGGDGDGGSGGERKEEFWYALNEWLFSPDVYCARKIRTKNPVLSHQHSF